MGKALEYTVGAVLVAMAGNALWNNAEQRDLKKEADYSRGYSSVQNHMEWKHVGSGGAGEILHRYCIPWRSTYGRGVVHAIKEANGMDTSEDTTYSVPMPEFLAGGLYKLPDLCPHRELHLASTIRKSESK
jgi:hypothetical protein